MVFYLKISYSLTNIFKNYGVNIVTTKINNLRGLLGNTKDKKEEGGKSGIYKIQCEKCDKCYVGQTKRDINIRFKEHLRNIKNQENKKISCLLNTNHNIKSAKLKKCK